MKATTSKTDPIQLRMQRGRKVARTTTLATLAALAILFFINPDLFTSHLKMPSAEERAEVKKQRKKKQNKKPKRRLTKKDIQRLAKLREKRARKHMMEILHRLEKRIVIAEQKEAAVTAKFRKSPNIFPSLQKLIPSHIFKFQNRLDKDIWNWSTLEKGNLGSQTVTTLIRTSWAIRTQGLGYQNAPSPDKLDAIISSTSLLESTLSGAALQHPKFRIEKQTHRYLKSIKKNSRAIKTQNRDLAVRGFACPEDHPLNSSQRQRFNQTLTPMSMARLHQLSQEMATHYTNLMGDVDAGKLAEIANIPFPQAIEKLAHQPYSENDLQIPLNQKTPENIDQLDDFTSALNEARISAERALEEAGGKAPNQNNGNHNDNEIKKSNDQSDVAKQGDGPLSSGGGKGTEISKNKGPQTTLGQHTREQIWRSLALESSLGASQDRTREITVDKKKVLANVIPGRRFSTNSARKGYLFIDTWHIIGPWNATANRHQKIDFSTIYPPETRLNLDAVYTTGKTHRIYDDERGYAGKDKLSGRLTWKFYQSPTVEVRIPREQLANDALYFAYTEVFFEQAMTMNLAIASDDAARIRLNGQIVFEDTGLSPYTISEQVRRLTFKKGVNKILVRLVNGPGPCRFSLLLSP